MKLEAIREDRTRGGRSTYQCSYTVPMLSPSLVDGSLLISNNRPKLGGQQESNVFNMQGRQNIPTLLQVSRILMLGDKVAIKLHKKLISVLLPSDWPILLQIDSNTNKIKSLCNL